MSEDRVTLLDRLGVAAYGAWAKQRDLIDARHADRPYMLRHYSAVALCTMAFVSRWFFHAEFASGTFFGAAVVVAISAMFLERTREARSTSQKGFKQ